MTLQFQLHELGWYSFEQLCRTICREQWHQPIEAYSRGPDGGMDGAFYGPWRTGPSRASAVLQCKHTTVQGRHLSLAHVEAEVEKIKSHAQAGRCDVYILMTNARVTGPSASAIAACLKAVGVKKVVVFGYDALCELLTQHKSLRALVPRLYGLGDLTEILDERSYDQAQAILATMHDNLARLVPVEAHRAAHRALREHGFVLLIGRPGSGKSSIAASLAIGAMDLYGARPVKLVLAEDLTNHWNPNDRHQFFWLDDGFGSTQYEHTAAQAWNRATRHIDAAIRGGARFVVTSRDYVYAAARGDLKTSALPLLEEARVVIEVESFTREEREQILYNHLRLGRQPPHVLAAMRPTDLEAVARDPSFLPELARRLGDPVFTRGVRVDSQESLLGFFRSPTPFLLEVLRNLDRSSRAALGLVHLRGGHLVSPYEDRPGDGEFLRRVGVALGDAIGALPALEGSLLRLVSVGGDKWWQFQHPSFTDAYQLWLEQDPELLSEYVASAAVHELVRTITCGNIGLEGALVVPRSLYDPVAARLISAYSSRHQRQGLRGAEELFRFLTHRSDEQFVRVVLARAPEIVDAAFSIGSSPSAYTSHRDLARLLLDLKLATEIHRYELVEALTEYAVEGDGTFLADRRWLEFFRPEELDELDRRVLEELDTLEEWVAQDLDNSQGDASFVDESVKGFEARYPRNPHVVAARQRVTRFMEFEPEPDAETWTGGEEGEQSPPALPPHRLRSIFDDLSLDRQEPVDNVRRARGERAR